MSSVKRTLPGICLLLVLGLLLFASCNKNASGESTEALVVSKGKGKAYFEFFDTVSYVYSYAGDSDEIFDQRTEQVAQVLEKYHRLFDIYYEYSGINNLCTVNRNAGKDPVEVDRELIDFLDYAVEMYRLTNGKMNIAMGAVLKQWHEARSAQEHFVPEEKDLEEGAKHIGLECLEIDHENCTVRITDALASIDVGALGKGYATEKAAQFLEENGVSAYVLNIGGNVRIIGTKADGSGWNTGIRNPNNPDGPFALRLNISDCSCVTSGTYERFFLVDGVKYHHIIDEKTLQPARYFESVTIICHDSGLADTLSTAVFCMPYEDGRALIDSLPGVDCVWIYSDDRVKYTDGIKNLIEN